LAINYPGPLEVRIYYTVSGQQHVHRFSCFWNVEPSPGTLFSGVALEQHNGSPVYADVYVDAYVAFIRDFYNDTDASLDYAEIWKYESGTFNAQFISTYDIGLAGLAATSTQLASELIFTFRTQEGGVGKLAFEDVVYYPGPSLAYPAMSSQQTDFVDHILSVNAVVIGRDTSRMLGFIRMHPGQNERNFKKRFRL